MVFSMVLLATCLSGTEVLASPERAPSQAEGGKLSSPSGGKKGGSGKKKGKKKGKRKGKDSESPGLSVPLWGNASVVTSAGVGATYASAVETQRGDGHCEEDEEDCAYVNNTNSADGWGTAFTVGAAFPGLVGKRSMAPPALIWSRHSLTLEGEPRAAGSPSSSFTQVQDSAVYTLSLDQYRAGLLIGGKAKKKSLWGGRSRIDIGYATGDVRTQVGSEAGARVGSVRGLVWNIDASIVFAPSKHLQLAFTPLGFTWMRLTPSNPETFPFLLDSRTRVAQFPFLVEAMASF